MKSSLIKITKTAVALIAIVAAGGLLVGAFHSETATAQLTTMSQICSNATLLGDYAFRISGETFLPGTNTIDKYTDGVAMTHFNGMGGLTQEDWIVRNGVSDPPPTTGFHGNESGTYTVHSDCTGNFTINFPIPRAVLLGPWSRRSLFWEKMAGSFIRSCIVPPRRTRPSRSLRISTATRRSSEQRLRQKMK
jgi:hypothetical protein